METIYIVNITTFSFFRYNKKNENDCEFNKILLKLLTPPNKNLIYSHWNRNDKIVFAPKHLHNYIERIYSELYL